MKKYKYIEIDGESFIEEVNPITNIFDQKIHRKEEFENFKPQQYSWLGEPFEGEISESEVEIVWQHDEEGDGNWVEYYKSSVVREDVRQAATPKHKSNHIPDAGQLVSNKTERMEDEGDESSADPYGYVFENKFYKSLDELKGQTFFEGNEPVAVYTKNV